MKRLTLAFFLLSLLGIPAIAQNPFDSSKLPAAVDTPEQFAPPGWKVEEVVSGDLNGDGKPDAAIKLAQIDTSKESGIGGGRALVIAFNENGKWNRIAIATKLLQCVDCGGAFYGVLPAPAEVRIAKGVLEIENEHGSRNVSRSNFKFRYDANGRFLLIGYDYVDYDRLDASDTNESTNYLTNTRITKTAKGKRASNKRSVIKPTRIYIEDVDGDEIEGQALHRLGLD